MISVCIPTYNGATYIKRQIMSILPQLKKDDELLVLDDGSTDNTVQELQSIQDNRIRILQNKKNQGLTKSINLLLSSIKGDYVFLSDQDDIWFPEKVSECMKYLSSYDLVITDCKVVDETLNTQAESFFTLNKTLSHKSVLKGILKNPYMGSCMAFQSKILINILPIPKNTYMHDIWIGNLANILYRIKFIDQPLMYYCRHSNNCSTASEKSNNSIQFRIHIRLILIFELIKRFIITLLRK